MESNKEKFLLLQNTNTAVIITPRHPDAVHPSKNEISYSPVYNRPPPNVIFNDCYTERTTKLDDYTFKGKPNKNIETELEFMAFWSFFESWQQLSRFTTLVRSCVDTDPLA